MVDFEKLKEEYEEREEDGGCSNIERDTHETKVSKEKGRVWEGTDGTGEVYGNEPE